MAAANSSRTNLQCIQRVIPQQQLLALHPHGLHHCSYVNKRPRLQAARLDILQYSCGISSSIERQQPHTRRACLQLQHVGRADVRQQLVQVECRRCHVIPSQLMQLQERA